MESGKVCLAEVQYDRARVFLVAFADEDTVEEKGSVAELFAVSAIDYLHNCFKPGNL